LQDAPDLQQDLGNLGSGKVDQRAERHHPTQGFVGDRELPHVALNELDTGVSPPSFHQHLRGQIHADDLVQAVTAQVVDHLAGSTP